MSGPDAMKKINSKSRKTKRRDLGIQNTQPYGGCERPLKLNVDQKCKEQEKNTAQKRVARMDPEYRKREQERNTISKRLARMDPKYKKKEQERNTESKRKARLDPEYRKREQERAKFAHQMAKLGLNPDGTPRVDRTKVKPPLIQDAKILSTDSENGYSETSDLTKQHEMPQLTLSTIPENSFELSTNTLISNSSVTMLKMNNTSNSVHVQISLNDNALCSDSMKIESSNMNSTNCTSIPKINSSKVIDISNNNVYLVTNLNCKTNLALRKLSGGVTNYRDIICSKSMTEIILPELECQKQVAIGNNQISLSVSAQQSQILAVTGNGMHDSNDEVVYLRI